MSRSLDGRRNTVGLTVKEFMTMVMERRLEGTIPESIVALYENSAANGCAAA